MNLVKEKSGVNLKFIDNKKFKTNIIGIIIRNKLDKKYVSKNAIISQVLKEGCNLYPTRKDMAIKIEEMNGSIFDISIIKKGDEQLMFFFLEMIKDKNIFKQGIKFLNQVIFNPLVIDKSFNRDIVERQKRILYEKLKSRSDDKKEYAKSRCLEIMCNNEGYGIYPLGYINDIAEINGKNLYQQYQNIINNSEIDIIVSAQNTKENNDLIEENLNFKSRYINKKEIFNIKNFETKNIYEKMDISQGKLVMGFSIKKFSKDMIYNLFLYNEILGAGASSKLFLNLREKENLCYYINSYINPYMGAIFVQSGISIKDFDKSVRIINDTVNNMKDKITDDEIKNAKDGLIKYFKGLNDYQTGIMDFYMNNKILQLDDDIEDVVEIIEKIKFNDIKDIAERVELNTTYFLSNSETGRDKNATNY